MKISGDFESIEASFVDQKTENDIKSAKTVIYSIIQRFCSENRTSFADKTVSLINTEIAKRRLRNVGLSLMTAESIIERFRFVGINNEDELNDVLTEFMGTAFLDDKRFGCPKLLLHLAIQNLGLSLDGFTYDYKLFIRLKTLSLYDNERSSILDLNSYSKVLKQLNPYLKINTACKNNASNSSIQEILSEAPAADEYAFTMEMSESDSKFSFAQGGYNTSYALGAFATTLEQSKTRSLTIGLGDAFIDVDTSSMFDILAQLSIINMRIANRSNLPKRKDKSKGSSKISQTDIEKSNSFISGDDAHRTSGWEKSGAGRSVQHNCMVLYLNLERLSVVVSCSTSFFTLLRASHMELQFSSSPSTSELFGMVFDISLIDLTAGGFLHREILWTKSGDSTTPVITIIISPQDQLKYVFSCSVYGLRVAFLYRFLSEFIYIAQEHFTKPIQAIIKDLEDLSKKSLDQALDPGSNSSVFSFNDISIDEEEVKASLESVKQSQEKENVNPQISILFQVSIEDFCVIVPRNSSSLDVIGFKADHASIRITNEREAFKAPTKQILNPKFGGHLYFDPLSNRWIQDQFSANYPARSNSNDDQEIDFSVFHDADDTEKINQINSPDEVTENNEALRIAVDLCETIIYTSIDQESDEQISVKARRSSRRTYSTVASVTFDETDPCVTTYLEIENLGFVRQPKEGASSNYRNRWVVNSRSELNLRFVLDITSTETKLLFGDTENLSSLDLAASQSEFYLLMALWFDNVYEKPRFLPKALTSQQNVTQTESTTKVERNFENEDHLPPRFIPFQSSSAQNGCDAYGSIEYIRDILERKANFELMVVRAYVALGCGVDLNYFSKEIPWSRCLNNLESQFRDVLPSLHPHFNTIHTASSVKTPTTADRRKSKHASRNVTGVIPRKVIPIADCRVEGFLLHVSNDDDVTRLFISAGKSEVYDSRVPVQSAIPLVFRMAPSDERTNAQDLYHPSTRSNSSKGLALKSIVYGISDFDFGFDRKSIETDCQQDVPFMFTLMRSVPSNWLTMNVGLDMVDMNVNGFDIVLLIADYFSDYFRFIEYGHPSVKAFSKLDKHIIPYGAVDLRMFIYRPHINILSSSSMVDPPCVLIEAERGLFFRYTADTKGAYKYTTYLNDLAVVLVKHYRPPAAHRGARGSSGSGRGYRTAIEFLNAILQFSYDSEISQLDVRCEIFNPQPNLERRDSDETGEKYVDIKENLDRVDVVHIPEPVCLFPLLRSDKEFTRYSCDIVTCYEDILFAVSTIRSSFAGITGAPPKANGKINESDEPFRKESSENIHENADNSHSDSFSTFMVIAVTGMRLMIVDNVLGLHLPLFQVIWMY